MLPLRNTLMRKMGELIKEKYLLEELGYLDGFAVILPDLLGVERVIDRTS